jgi:hypothetical protein
VNAAWFYSVGDTRQGPVTEDDLKALAADGRLKPSDLVWKDGMADWVEARTVPTLFPPRAEPRRDDEDRPSRRRRDEYDDDRPGRRGRRDDEMDDDRPRVRRRDDDRYEDDEDERPRKLQKPGQVQAVGIMMLVGGILGVLTALGLGIAAIPTVICCFWPGIYLELVVGILLIIRGVNMMNQDDQGPPRTLAILQILFILNLDIVNCVLGVVGLIMLNDPKVEEYYRRRGF